jgi:predicted kinase
VAIVNVEAIAMSSEPTLHLLCGKIAAGKSTLTASLRANPDTIVLAEDAWLSRLYPNEMTSVADYIRRSACLRDAIGPHVIALLQSGMSVVLDFPANTVSYRAWMRTLFEAAGSAHQLHFLDVPDAVCKARLRARNAAGAHEYAATDAQFDVITSYFVPPLPEEGFNVIVHRSEG